MSSHSTTFGATTVLSSSMVNALRVAVNVGKVDVFQTPFFSPKDIGANLYSYVPGYMTVNVTGGFLIYESNTAKALFLNDTYQLAEDLTIVRGNHQFGCRRQPELLRGRPHVHVALEWELDHQRFGHRPGDSRTCSSAASPASSTAGPNKRARQQLAHGVVCAGLVACVEPRDGQRRRAMGAVLRPERREQRDRDLQDGEFPAGDQEQGVPQRAGRPDLSGRRRVSAGTDRDWTSSGGTSRRASVWRGTSTATAAWRCAPRTPWAMTSCPASTTTSTRPPRRSATARRWSILRACWTTHIDPLGGDPHPIVTGPNTPYVPFGGFGTMDPGINSPRVQSWNVTVEQQLGSQWGVSASYLGSYSDRLWAPIALNPGDLTWGWVPARFATA